MGLACAVTLVVVSLSIAILYQKYLSITSHIHPPQLNQQQFWGKGDGKNYTENTAILPFDISVKPEIISDLLERLNRPLRLTEPLEDVNQEYGFNTIYLKSLITYWRENYLNNWEKHEAFLKRFPHFQTEIQGLKLHFIRVKPQHVPQSKKVIPLLLLHGWPSSVREYYDIIPLLTKPNQYNEYLFEVIVPSLPGYGWSQASAKRDFGPAQIAIVMRNLMLRLGHKKFLIQGGDWGSIIGSHLSAFFPQNVIGFHSNMCMNYSPLSVLKSLIASVWPSLFYEEQYKEFFKSLPELFIDLMKETGYMHLQATKPDTIGIALSNNPVGLAAYILEKFVTWTLPEDKGYIPLEIQKHFHLSALFDNLMIYYVTNSINTSQRIYAEYFSKSQRKLQLHRVPISVPTGCAHFKQDLMHYNESQLKERFTKLIHSTYHKKGGHFAAMEVPDIFYSDFIEFVTKL